jgi:hypothetical protein
VLRRHVGAREIALAAAAFLLLGLGLFAHAWLGGPTTVTTCGCGDAARFLWFFAWPAHVLSHGGSLFWSPAMLHPTGLNLLNDTSVLALGVVLTPLTWLAGPVLSMNVALTLAPALAGTTTYVAVRRFGAAWWAAGVGGLLVGFSPFMVTELGLNQLNIVFFGLLPLLVVAADELLIVQRRSARTVGLILAGLVVVQFFISIEVLVLMGVLSCLAILVLLIAGRREGIAERRHRLAHAAVGVAWGIGASVAILAYPVWFYFAGPAHLHGPVWGAAALGAYGTTLRSFVDPAGLASLATSMRAYGGYQGPVLPGLGYIGAGVLLVGLVGSIVAWRRGPVRLAVVLGLCAGALTLRPGSFPVPWAALEHLGILSSVVELRFTLFVMLCLAVIIALGATDAADWLGARQRHMGIVVAVVLVVGSLPTAWSVAANVPLTARAVVLPAWFRSPAATTSSSKVLLTYPFPSSGLQSSLAWQAVDAMAWSQAGGGGPAGLPSRAGAHSRAALVLDEGSLGLGPPPAISSANVAAVRAAVVAWGVTTIVVPLDRSLPAYERGRSRAWAIAMFSAVEGAPPSASHHALVWSHAGQVAARTTAMPTAASLACAGEDVAHAAGCTVASLAG